MPLLGPNDAEEETFSRDSIEYCKVSPTKNRQNMGYSSQFGMNQGQKDSVFKRSKTNQEILGRNRSNTEANSGKKQKKKIKKTGSGDTEAHVFGSIVTDAISGSNYSVHSIKLEGQDQDKSNSQQDKISPEDSEKEFRVLRKTSTKSYCVDSTPQEVDNEKSSEVFMKAVETNGRHTVDSTTRLTVDFNQGNQFSPMGSPGNNELKSSANFRPTRKSNRIKSSGQVQMTDH